LPADVEFAQDIFISGAKFAFSVLKHLCKKQWSNYTDNTPTYPRPPRTVSYPVQEAQSVSASSSDESEVEEEEEGEDEGAEEEEVEDKSSVEEKNE
jgi:hypothetical protein